MSRVVLKTKGDATEVALGIDPLTRSWFVQVFGKPSSGGEDVMILEKDLASRGVLIDAMNEHTDMEDPYVKAVYNCVVLDLDPAQAVR